MSFSLVTTWSPATATEPLGYGIELTNNGDTPIANFKLGFSGPARIDPQATLENGKLLKRLSNHTLIAPPDGYVLEPGATWTSTARGLSYGLRHWSDGANSAYLVLEGGEVVAIPTAPTQGKGHNSPLLKGAVKFPVPAKAPAPFSIIPWPNHVAATGNRIAPPGYDLKPVGDLAGRAAAAFADLTAELFPVEAIVRPAAGIHGEARRDGGLQAHFPAAPGDQSCVSHAHPGRTGPAGTYPKTPGKRRRRAPVQCSGLTSAPVPV